MLVNKVHNLVSSCPESYLKGQTIFKYFKTKSIIVLGEESSGTINSLNFLRNFLWYREDDIRNIGKPKEHNRVKELADYHTLRSDFV